MRMSTYGIPRIIWSLDETDEYIGIPRGCKSSFISLLKDVNLECVYEDKRTPIILTQRREHVMLLADMLRSQTNAHIITLVGSDSVKKKRLMTESLKSILPKEQLIIVATGKYIGEGFDYPRLDTLFFASPIAWKGTLTQYAGRLHREYPEKQDVIIYDYVDMHIPVLERMYHKRLKAYFQIAYKALASKEEPDKINMIYDSDTFRSAMKKDVEDSKKEILIVCPYVRKKQVNLIFDLLKNPLEREISIKIITLPIESYKEQELARKNIEILQTAVNVKFQADIYQKYVIIDNRLVWYGSIGLLDYTSADDTIMRLESRELAVELRTESVIE